MIKYRSIYTWRICKNNEARKKKHKIKRKRTPLIVVRQSSWRSNHGDALKRPVCVVMSMLIVAQSLNFGTFGELSWVGTRGWCGGCDGDEVNSLFSWNGRSSPPLLPCPSFHKVLLPPGAQAYHKRKGPDEGSKPQRVWGQSRRLKHR